MVDTVKCPEILAPAGHIDGFYAAIDAGCDGVYLGGLCFGARDYAKNFDHKTLKEVVRYGHLKGVRIYYTLNTLIKDIEFKQLEEELQFLKTLHLDGLIIQDLGVYEYIRQHHPHFILHGSTQMNIHTVSDAQFYKQLGFERVVLARECTLDEIKKIREQVDIEVETFVHGALCYSYSGQCLMSSFYGGRSGNRGKCAGPCRLPFEVDQQQGYYLSMKDQMTLHHLPKLILAGIDSFKIEGRMKNAEYAFHVTRLYKKYRALAIQCIKNQCIEDYYVNSEDLQRLAVLYNRGNFTSGYYFTQEKSQISIEHPRHLGLYVGTARVKGNKIHIALQEPLYKGDMIEWHIPELKYSDERFPNTTLEQDFAPKTNISYDKKKLSCGQKIMSNQEIPLYKVYDPQLTKEWEERIAPSSIPIEVEVWAHVGHPLKMIMSNPVTNKKLTVEGFVVEPAKKQPLMEAQLKKQLSKTEGQFFSFVFKEIHIKDDGFVPMGAINQLRRDGLLCLETDQLQQHVALREPYQLIHQPTFADINKSFKSVNSVKPISSIRVSITSLDQWYGLKEAASFKQKINIDRIYIECTDLMWTEIQQILNEKTKVYPKSQCYIGLPHILFSAEEEKLKVLLNHLNLSDIDGFLVRSLGQILVLKDYNKPFASDRNLHVFNQWSAQFLSQYMTTITASVELHQKGLNGILSTMKMIDIEWVGYGHQPLMESKTCIYKSRYNTCGYTDSGQHMIVKDRKGEQLHVMCHCQYCYTTLYNAKATNLIDDQPKIKGQCRIEFTFESKEEVFQKMVELYSTQKIGFDKEYMTKGHIQRGVK